MLELLKAIVYGIIEGITEWLPISSTGHMILAEQVLKFNFSAEFMTMFRVVIQLGAILAVVIIFWKSIWPFCKDNGKVHPAANAAGWEKFAGAIGRHIKWPIMILWFKIIVACIPAGVLGILLDNWMDEHLYNYWVVAATLILYGIFFLFIEKDHAAPRLTKLRQITYKDALIIGLWQALSLVPGTSRSGSTIIGGMLLGLSRPLAAQFTFFLAIPVMAGASLLKAIKYLAAGLALSGLEWGALALGCLVAFLVSMVAIRFLMNYVRNHDFKIFGIYRIILGVIVLIFGIVSLVMTGQGATPAA